MSEVDETKKCTNCNQEILSNNYTVHFLHCQRNFYFCSECQQPVNYKEKIRHDKESHAYVFCTYCHIKLKRWRLDNHFLNECSHRKVKCEICDIEVKATDISEHENYCGSRTEKCAECGEFVMFKYKSLHLDSNHTFIKLSDEPGPSPAWQYGRRTLYNFMPDPNSKSQKPVSNQKRKSEEVKKSGNSESGLNNNDRLSTKSEIYAAKPNTTDFSKIKARKSFRKDCEEWPSVSNFKSLQISKSKQDSTSVKGEAKEMFKIKTRPFSQENKNWTSASNIRPLQSIVSKEDNNETGVEFDEESDLMYAIQVSQELNSHFLKKEEASGDSQILNNQFQTPDENSKNKNKFKNVEKIMFSSNIDKEDTRQKNWKDFECSSVFSDEEPIKLPCEFCGALIVAHNLVFHQNRCNLFMRDTFVRRDSKNNFSFYGEDIDNKILCAICNKFFKLPVFESHQQYCQKTSKFSKSDKPNHSRNIISMNVKSEPGLQNGIEHSSPRLSRMGTRSEWLSELSKSTSERDSDYKSMNEPGTGVVKKITKVSRKNRRAPSPPKM